MKIKQVKKLTSKVIMGLEGKPSHEIKTFLTSLASTDAPELYHVKGEITAYGGRVTQYNKAGEESFFFVGFFAAQNLQDGTLLSASKIYLPRDVTEDLIAAFKTRTGDAAVSFDLVVSLASHDTTGYTYVSRPQRDPEAVNREQELLASFKPLALAAPKNKKA